MVDPFQSAVKFIEICTAEYVDAGKLIVPPIEPKRQIHMLQLDIFWVPDDSGDLSNTAGRFVCSNQALDSLLGICTEDAAAYDLLHEIAVHRLATFDDFPPPLRSFVVASMTKIFVRPKSERRVKTWHRNLFLYLLAKQTELYLGLDLTRNASSKAQTSACDAVSQGLARNGHYVSAEAVIDLCNSSKAGPRKLRQEFEHLVSCHLAAMERSELHRHHLRCSWLSMGEDIFSPR